MGWFAIGFALLPVSAGGQTCHKVVSFAKADETGVHLFMGTGNWIGNWVEKNAKKYPDICFAQNPMAGTANYVIVLSQAAGYLSGFDPVVRTSSSSTTSPVSGSGTATNNYGDTWNFNYNGTVTTTTTTTSHENVPYTIRSNTIYAGGYSDGGVLVSNHHHVYSTKSGGDAANSAGYNIGNAIGAINARGRLLNSVVKDISTTPIVEAVATPASAEKSAREMTPTPAPIIESRANPNPTPSTPCKTYLNTGEKEFISDNAHGTILILSDGSIWQVTDVDVIDSSLWLPSDDVIVMRAEDPVACFGYLIINTDEHAEEVHAKYLGQR